MDTVNTQPNANRARCETEAGKQRHHQLTMEGLAHMDAGQLIDDEAMKAWADSLGTDRQLPIPQPD